MFALRVLGDQFFIRVVRGFLIALHGRGEALKGVARGARGWLDDYAIGKTLRRLAKPPLTRADLLRMVDSSRLATINARLASRPFGKMVLVFPYTPDITAPTKRKLNDAKPFARFIVETLLPRLHRETPAIGTPATTGIDGVSLGGRAALLVGLQYPKRFAAVGSLQAAIYPGESRELARRAKLAIAANPQLQLRLLTSTGDFFRVAIGRLSKALSRAGVKHAHRVVVGPHSYAFNRGPGGYEMLLFHDRVLRATR